MQFIPFIIIILITIVGLTCIFSNKARVAIGKFLFAVVLFALLVYGACALQNAAMAEEYNQGFYPRCAVVTSIEEDVDLVIAIDGAGIEWRFYGIEDLAEGDLVALLLWDCGTPSIYDDEIIDVCYSALKVEP